MVLLSSRPLYRSTCYIVDWEWGSSQNYPKLLRFHFGAGISEELMLKQIDDNLEKR